jgi:hypothetical protein
MANDTPNMMQTNRGGIPAPATATTAGEWEAVARYLWALLDNIDTLDDACRGDDLAFRNHTRREQKRRWEISSSDGYTIMFSARLPGACPSPAVPGEELDGS